eukprot:5197724-Amphidinium_carterae.1
MSARPMSTKSKCANKSLGLPAPGSKLRNNNVAMRSGGIPYRSCAASASRFHSRYADGSPPN